MNTTQAIFGRDTKPILIGSLSSMVFVFLMFGPLYPIEWTYLFYGIMLSVALLNIALHKGRNRIKSARYSVIIYVLVTIALVAALSLFRSNRIDLRFYLTDNVTNILHRYKSAENSWKSDFQDPTGFVYYNNIKDSDISALLAMQGKDIWEAVMPSKHRPSAWELPRKDWIKNFPESYQNFSNHPDTRCTYNDESRTFCINKTTHQILFHYL